MSRITARLPDELVQALDAAARELNRTRAGVIRQAAERRVEDLADLSTVVERLRDPSDPVLDRDDVERELLDQDQAERRQGDCPDGEAGAMASDARHRPSGRRPGAWRFVEGRPAWTAAGRCRRLSSRRADGAGLIQVDEPENAERFTSRRHHLRAAAAYHVVSAFRRHATRGGNCWRRPPLQASRRRTDLGAGSGPAGAQRGAAFPHRKS